MHPQPPGLTLTEQGIYINALDIIDMIELELRMM